jgi:hypothetical protein
MSHINEEYFDQSCESKQATLKQHCLNKCSHNSNEYFETYVNKLGSAIKADCKVECLEELKAYMGSIPAVYDSDLYSDKKQVATGILTKIDDKDFTELATKTLNYILLDNFHENLKYGEKHLDTRIDIARDLFSSKDEAMKDMGAQAILHYIKNNEISTYARKYYIEDLISYKKSIGLDGLKFIIQDTKTFNSYKHFDRDAFSYFYKEISPREPEKVKLWADMLGEIVNDSAIWCKGRKFAYERLIDYKDHYNVRRGVFDQCRNNKVCIKEITDSLEHVDKWIAGITKLADYPFYCDD